MVGIAERTVPTATWAEANQRHLVRALATVRGALERHLGQKPGAAQPATIDGPLAPWALPHPPALDRLCALFRLSLFERDLLLLCAGIELDARFPALCAQAHGDPQRGYATFGLALAVLPGAHWSALGPAAPLRHWRLCQDSVPTFLVSSVRRAAGARSSGLAAQQHGLKGRRPLHELMPPFRQ